MSSRRRGRRSNVAEPEEAENDAEEEEEEEEEEGDRAADAAAAADADADDDADDDDDDDDDDEDDDAEDEHDTDGGRGDRARHAKVRKSPMELAAEAKHEQPQQLEPVKAKTSKYDYVKVRVWLHADKREYYHVFSRYLLSRALMAIELPPKDAVRVALRVKKLLVDAHMLDVHQSELEDRLFAVMWENGFGDEFVERYRLINQFHLERRPLIVMVMGTDCLGAKAIATELSSRLNTPRILQTSTALLMSGSSANGALSPVYLDRDLHTEEEVLARYADECEVVRHALDGDLQKCLREGKSIILEGMHLNPRNFGDLLSKARRQAALDEQPIVASFLLHASRRNLALMAHAELGSHMHARVLAGDGGAVSGGADADANADVDVLGRLELIQSYLVDAASQGSLDIPLVEVDVHDIDAVVEHLHRSVVNLILDTVRGSVPS